MEGLTVTKAATTLTEDSTSYGAVTLFCMAEGVEVTVRTEPLYENGSLITQDRYVGKSINVKGVVDYYDGAYQIRVLIPEHITIY